MKNIEVVVAAEARVVIAGFYRFIDSYSNISLVAHATSLDDLGAILAMRRVAVTIVEWQLVAAQGHDAHTTIKQLAARTSLILSGVPESPVIRRDLLLLGARGLITKQHTGRHVANAIHQVSSGGTYMERTRVAEPCAAETSLSPQQRGGVASRRDLTAREREVVRLVCNGLNNRLIAATLYISETTVCHHLTSIYAKVNVRGRTGLVSYAYQNNLAPADRIPSQATQVEGGPLRVISGGGASAVPHA